MKYPIGDKIGRRICKIRRFTKTEFLRIPDPQLRSKITNRLRLGALQEKLAVHENRRFSPCAPPPRPQWPGGVKKALLTKKPVLAGPPFKTPDWRFWPFWRFSPKMDVLADLAEKPEKPDLAEKPENPQKVKKRRSRHNRTNNKYKSRTGRAPHAVASPPRWGALVNFILCLLANT